MEPLKTNTENGFPSDFLPMRKKAQKQWHLDYSRGLNKSHKRLVDSKNFIKFKELSEGRTPVDYYKKIMGSRNRAGKADISWRNLDYAILPILPKFIKILKNNILNEPKEFKIKAIDPYSISQERKRKNQIISYMVNKEVNQMAAQVGAQVNSPFEQGEAMPSNVSQIDTFMDAYPKNRHVSEMYDELNQAFNVNKWDQVSRKVVDNIIKHGFAGTWPYIDSKGYVRIDNMHIERVITNACEENDFSDMTRIGEYVPMTIGQIRQLAAKEIASGEITEKMLAAAASTSGKVYVPSGRDSVYEQARTFGSYVAAYDHEKVMVLRWQCKSTDTIAYVINNVNGEITLEPRDNPFWLDKKNISDDQYSEFQKSQGLDKSILRTELENIYHAYHVVDSDIIFAYGLKTDIQRNLNSLAKAEFDAKIYTLDFDSVVRQLESAAHNAQINWLQYQHHSAMSIPDGLAISKRALTTTQIGGKGGVVLDELDLMDMYIQTGRFIYRDLDGNMKPIEHPFQVIKGTDPSRALHHLEMVFKNIDLIRNILGLNELTDASTPNPDAGKKVSEIAVASSNTALGDFKFAYKYLYEETARSVVRLLPMARKKKNPGYIEALGKESQMYSEANSDRDFLDFGITLDVGWDQEKHQSLVGAATASLKSAGGSLRPQDIYIIQNEQNPEKAYMLLESKSKEREDEDHNKALQLSQENAKVQQQSAMVAEQAKQQTLQMQMQFDQMKHEMDKDKLSHEAQLKAFLIKLEKGLEFSNDEKDRFANLVMAHDKNRAMLEATEISASAKKQQKSA